MKKKKEKGKREKKMPKKKEELGKPEKEKKEKKEKPKNVDEEYAKNNDPFSQNNVTTRDLEHLMDKIGLGESQQAKSLKRNIGLTKAYFKEHEEQIELFSHLTWIKYLALTKRGFTNDQAFGFIASKGLFDF